MRIDDLSVIYLSDDACYHRGALPFFGQRIRDWRGSYSISLEYHLCVFRGAEKKTENGAVTPRKAQKEKQIGALGFLYESRQYHAFSTFKNLVLVYPPCLALEKKCVRVFFARSLVFSPIFKNKYLSHGFDHRVPVFFKEYLSHGTHRLGCN